MFVFPIVYLVTPFTALIQDTTTRFAVFLFIMLIKGFVVIIGFPCTTILLTNSASSLRILGTVNGFATTFSGVGRAIGPAAVGAVFSWGARTGYAIAPWWLLAVIGFIGAIPPWFIVDGEGPNRGSGAGDREEATDAEREGLLGSGRTSDDEGEEDEDAATLEGVASELESGPEIGDGSGGGRQRKKKRGGEYGSVSEASG